MKTAISIFKERQLVDAYEVTYSDVQWLRLACPECLKPVILVDRIDTRYFRHYAKTEHSPFCSLRVSTSGRSSYSEYQRSVNDIFKEEVFQKAISKICVDSSPISLEEPYLQIVESLIKLMHEIIQNEDRLILIEDLPEVSVEYKGAWTTTEKLVRENFIFLSTHYPEWISTYESLRTEGHIFTVLLLWKHLHLERVEDDLRFLLQKALESCLPKPKFNLPNTYRENIVDEARSAVIFHALSILATVPWRELPAFLKSPVRMEGIRPPKTPVPLKI
jgi:hypothetical protein